MTQTVTTESTSRPRWRSLAGNTGIQVLIAAIAGAIFGLIWSDTGAELKPLADGFISLIRLVIPPIVFLVVVTGIVSVGGMKAVGRIALKAIIYFEIVTTIGTLLGLAAINFFRPGDGVAPPADASSELSDYVDNAKEKSVDEFLLDLVPENAVDAFATGHILQILVFAILFSIALLTLPKTVSEPIARGCGKLSEVFFRMVRMIIRLAPIGTFGAVAFTVGKYGPSTLTALMKYVGLALITLIVFLTIVLGTVTWFAGTSLVRLIRGLRKELYIVLGTSSSETVMPHLMARMEEFGCKREVVGLVVPTGYSFNLDGVAVVVPMSAVFIAQVYGVPLSFADQLTLFLVFLFLQGNRGNHRVGLHHAGQPHLRGQLHPGRRARADPVRRALPVPHASHDQRAGQRRRHPRHRALGARWHRRGEIRANHWAPTTQGGELALPRITAIHAGTVPISSSISNAFIDFRDMDCSIVAVVSDVIRAGKPVVGYGFSSNGRYSATDIMQRRIIPRLLGSSVDPFEAWDAMMRNEKPGGHGERSVAVGVIDMALFDLAAKLDDQPLYRWLAERHGSGEPDPDVFVYAAGGYYAPGKGLRELRDEMRAFLDLGYHVVKMKIGGASLAEDLKRVEAVLEVLGGDGARLAVDANGRFDLDTALRYGEALEPYNLFWYEEPGDPLDFALHATLAERYPCPLATGENLFSLPDARNLLRYAGMRPDRDTIQVDPVLSYGLVEYLRIQDLLRQQGWSSRRCIPHGGHQFSLHIAAALRLGGNESYPGEFQPTGGFADSAVIAGSRVALTDAPGIGFEQKAELYKVFRELHAA